MLNIKYTTCKKCSYELREELAKEKFHEGYCEGCYEGILWNRPISLIEVHGGLEGQGLIGTFKDLSIVELVKLGLVDISAFGVVESLEFFEEPTLYVVKEQLENEVECWKLREVINVLPKHQHHNLRTIWNILTSLGVKVYNTCVECGDKEYISFEEFGTAYCSTCWNEMEEE